MNAFLMRMPKMLHSKGRVVIVLVVLAALGLQYFTWFQRYPQIARQQERVKEIARLEEDVQILNRKWSEEEAARAQTKLDRSLAMLFTGDVNSSAWSSQIQQPENVTSFAITVRSDAPLPCPDPPDTVTIVPTRWTIKPANLQVAMLPELLAFLRKLSTEQPKRMDLVDLSISGNGGALVEAQASYRLWFEKGEETAAPAKAKNPRARK